MKITDEMVKRAAFSHRDHDGCEWRHQWKAALEAALKDVPEPPTGGLGGPEALRLRISCERFKSRSEAAEAKLAKVQSWLYDAESVYPREADKLQAILDGE